MDRRRHRARRQAPRRDERHSRTDDARARPPSRSGARRQPARGCAPCCSRAIRCAPPGGPARRASRPLCWSRESICAPPAFLPRRTPSTASRISRRLCRLLPERDPHAGIHAALDAILDALGDPRRGRADDRALRAGLPRPSSASGSISPPARPPARPPISSTCRRARAAPSRAPPASLSRQAAAAAGLPAGRRRARLPPPISPTPLRSTGFFLERHAFAPRGLALPDARARFVAAVLVRSGQPRYPVAP